MIYRVQKGGIYAGRENFKKHDLPRAKGGMNADNANFTQLSEVLREPNASQEEPKIPSYSTNGVKSSHMISRQYVPLM